MSTPKMRDQVLACIPPAPEEVTPKQVHETLGMWAYRTVKGTLTDLRADGIIVRCGTEQAPTYRRAA